MADKQLLITTAHHHDHISTLCSSELNWHHNLFSRIMYVDTFHICPVLEKHTFHIRCMKVYHSSNHTCMHKIEWLSRDNLSSPPFALVTYDLYACEELIHPFIRQKSNNIMLRQETLFNIYEPKISIYDIYTSQ